MPQAVCTQCATGLVMEIARVLIRSNESLYRLSAFKLFKCPRCGAVFVPKNAGTDVSPEAVVATCPDELCDILFAGQRW